MNEPRLLGSWQSDRERTFERLKPGPKSTPQSFAKFKALFGKVVVRWTPNYCHYKLDGDRWKTPYRVVARDDESVVIEAHDELTGGDCLHHIRFEDDAYQLFTRWGMIEWFKRIEIG